MIGGWSWAAEEPLTPALSPSPIASGRADGEREDVSAPAGLRETTFDSVLGCGPNFSRSFWMIWTWGTPSRSIWLSWSRISLGRRATLPQRARVVAENGLLDLGLAGFLDLSVCGSVAGMPGRMSDVVAGLWFVVFIGFVCGLVTGDP